MKNFRKTTFRTGFLFLLFATVLLFHSPARYIVEQSDDTVMLLEYGRELIDTVRSSLEALPPPDRSIVEAGLNRLDSAWKDLKQIRERNGDTTAATDRLLSLLHEMASGDIPVQKGLKDSDEMGN